MPDLPKAVFLSYASQDAEAAKRICDALRAAGVEVWFDQSELVGGDAWDAKIKKQIRECALFVPIISPATNARAEGYFRREWKQAVERTHDMADDMPFLFPIVIGDVTDATARVPDKFREVQWTRLKLEETPSELAARIARLLAGAAPEDRGQRAEDRGQRRESRVGGWQWWMIFPILGTITGMLFAFVPLWRAILSRPEKPAPAPVSAPGKPMTENGGRRTIQAAEDKSVAVLAFANLSDDKANEYFSDGISEELLNVLAKIPHLKVSARTSAFFFKGKDTPIPEIARQLGVAYVVEGSVRKQGDKVRITAQLIKAADGFHVWSDTFTRDLKDIFAVQDEIAGLIARNLSLKLGMGSAPAARPVDPEAYRLMLLGRDLLYRGASGDLEQARGYLQEAVKRDGEFALAWAWLSITRWAQAANGWVPIESGFKAAREAAEQALALQPDLPEANTAIGFIYYGYDWDWARARAVFERAQALAPGDAAVLSNLTRLAITLGKNDEAVQLGRQAVALDPLNSYAQYVLSMALLQAGRYAELEQQVMDFKRVIRAPAKQQVFALLLVGKNEEALRVAMEFKNDNNRTFVLALANWACGHRAEADAGLARLKTEYASTAAYQIAELHAYRGERDEAFTWLETSYRQRDTGMIYLKNDPWLKSLQGDPRWGTMLRKMNLADGQVK